MAEFNDLYKRNYEPLTLDQWAEGLALTKYVGKHGDCSYCEDPRQGSYVAVSGYEEPEADYSICGKCLDSVIRGKPTLSFWYMKMRLDNWRLNTKIKLPF